MPGVMSGVLNDVLSDAMTLPKYTLSQATLGLKPQGKVLAVTMMTVMGVYLAMFSALPGWAAAIACAGMLAVGIYIVTRPDVPKG